MWWALCAIMVSTYIVAVQVEKFKFALDFVSEASSKSLRLLETCVIRSGEFKVGESQNGQPASRELWAHNFSGCAFHDRTSLLYVFCGACYTYGSHDAVLLVKCVEGESGVRDIDSRSQHVFLVHLARANIRVWSVPLEMPVLRDLFACLPNGQNKPTWAKLYTQRNNAWTSICLIRLRICR
jgi:hypothetical protein